MSCPTGAFFALIWIKNRDFANLCKMPVCRKMMRKIVKCAQNKDAFDGYMAEQRMFLLLHAIYDLKEKCVYFSAKKGRNRRLCVNK